MKESQHIEWKETWRDDCLIHNACRGAGTPEPVFRWDNGLWVEFPLPEVKTPVKTLVKTPVKILQLLGGNPCMTLAEVAAAIGKSVSAVERASSKLVEEGRLQYIGPAKGGHWEVKGDRVGETGQPDMNPPSPEAEGKKNSRGRKKQS